MTRLGAGLALSICIILLVSALVHGRDRGGEYLSPCALAASEDGRRLYVALASAKRVDVVDLRTNKVVRQIEAAGEPSGLALSRDGLTLYVSCDAPRGTIGIIDASTGALISTISAGHGATSPVPDREERRLFICNRFDNSVGVIDLGKRRQVASIPAAREPVAAALDPGGRRLIVANLLPEGPADSGYTAASVDIIDTVTCKPLARIRLANGSTGSRGVCVSPDGKYAFVTHILARYELPTTQLDRGWINTNALSIIDLTRLKLLNTVLLDDVDRGAANPWAVACTGDGKRLLVTHAGTHELSVIDLDALLSRLLSLPAQAPEKKRVIPVEEDSYFLPLEKVLKTAEPYEVITTGTVRDSLAFMRDIRRRVELPGNGPRALVVIGGRAYVAEYFSDTISAVRIGEGFSGKASSIALGPPSSPSLTRRGEMLFNDGTICYQSWQSCASCHPDVRADGLNWDLLNDGMGNPKNTKSLVLSHQTPPVMASGIRKDAETAVRSGLKYIHFSVRPEGDAEAMDAYLRSLEPAPSPRLVDGKLSRAAERGRKVFDDAGCASCHSGSLLTDMRSHDVGTGRGADAGRKLDTPTLREAWRTGPYLHDGRAATLGEVISKHNPADSHGVTSGLAKAQKSDLVEYLLSL